MRNFIYDEDGQGMVEYGIIIGTVAIVAIVLLLALRGKITNLFRKTNEYLDDDNLYHA